MEQAGVHVVAKSDPNSLQLLTNVSQVILANSVTFKGREQLLQTRKQAQRLSFVHRIDGPYYVARYARSLDTIGAIPSEDTQTVKMNQKYACATVLQSDWSMKANFRIGLNLRNPVLVPNTVNPTIFHPQQQQELNKTTTDQEPSGKKRFEGRKIKILASSHSANARKGFDTMLWMDQNLDFDRFEFTFMGGTPKQGFETHNMTVRAEAPSEGLADVLREADVYLAPSRYEPASNAVLEALSSGLPVLYQEGSSHGELVGEGGVGFTQTGPELLEALDKLVENYDYHYQHIKLWSLEEVTRRYLSIMRWCFYMQNTILL